MADFHKPGIYQASKFGLTRGTSFVACRLEVVVVAALLWISWCVLGAAGFFRAFFFRFFFFERTRPATNTWPRCLIYLSTSNRQIEAVNATILPRVHKNLIVFE